MNEVREWRVFGALAFPKGGAAYDGSLSDTRFTDVVERKALDEARAGLERLKNAYAEVCLTRDYLAKDFNKATKELEALRAEIRDYRAALGEWIAWEKEQIANEGGYVGKRINELIQNGSDVLKKYSGGGDEQ